MGEFFLKERILQNNIALLPCVSVFYSLFDSIDFRDIKNNPNPFTQPVTYQLLSQTRKTVVASVTTSTKGILHKDCLLKQSLNFKKGIDR